MANRFDKLTEIYAKCGILNLFDWQKECLSLVDDNSKHLIYSAPTSAGKTLVAEFLMISNVLLNGKAIFILPYVAVARQKMTDLQFICKNLGIRIEGYLGTYQSTLSIDQCDIAVCTFEKANNLINRLICDGTIDQYATIVIDEFHMVGDPGRGQLLELLIMKILFYVRKNSLALQIIGMSATLPKLEILSKWLNNALTYECSFRPIPLVETIIINGKIFDKQMKPIRQLPDELDFPEDSDNLIGLTLETVLNGHGVLVFCPTKIACEKLAAQIAQEYRRLLSGHQVVKKRENVVRRLQQALVYKKCQDFVNLYNRIVPVLDPILRDTFKVGVSFHHAGLSIEERDLIERGFKDGTLRVIVATSTLSSGVNLPSKRVIIRSPWTSPNGKGPHLTISQYKQMVGRAGRKGIDTEGDSIIMCKKTELKRGLELMRGNIPDLKSSFSLLNNSEDSKSITSSFKRCVLEAFGCEMVCSITEMKSYVDCSLLAAQYKCDENDTLDDISSTAVDACTNWLIENEFLFEPEQNVLKVTQLGHASLASGFGPDESLAVFRDLRRAMRGIVLENDLHLVYLATPIYMLQSCYELSWIRFYQLWIQLPDNLRFVGERIGIREQFLVRAAQGETVNLVRKPGEGDARAVHWRFFVALALYDLVNEKSLSETALKFQCNRGFLQSLQQQCASYAGMITNFCERLGWHSLHTLLSGFSERIAFGVRRELSELVRIDGMDGSRAKVFHDAGIKTLVSLMNTDVEKIGTVVRKAVPFQSGVPMEKYCWLAEHPDLSDIEAASLLQSRARAIVQDNLANLGIVVDLKGANMEGGSDVVVNSDTVASISSTDEVVAQKEQLLPDMEEPANLESKNNSFGVPTVNDSSTPKSIKASPEFIPPVNRALEESFNDIDTSADIFDDGNVSEDSERKPIEIDLNCALDQILSSPTQMDPSSDDVLRHRTSPIDNESHDDFDDLINDMSSLSVFDAVCTPDSGPGKSLSNSQRISGHASSPFEQRRRSTTSTKIADRSKVSKDQVSNKENVTPSPVAAVSSKRRHSLLVSNTPSPVAKKKSEKTVTKESPLVPKLVPLFQYRVGGIDGVLDFIVIESKESFDCICDMIITQKSIGISFTKCANPLVEPAALTSSSFSIIVVIDCQPGNVYVCQDVNKIKKIIQLVKMHELNVHLFNLKHDLSFLHRVGADGLLKDLTSKHLYSCVLFAWLLDPDIVASEVSTSILRTVVLRYAPSNKLATFVTRMPQYLKTLPTEKQFFVQPGLCARAALTIGPLLLQFIRSKNKILLNPLENIELPVLFTLVNIENEGVCFDVTAAHKLVSVLIDGMNSLEKESTAILSHPINLSSSSAVAKALYEELKLPPDGDPSKNTLAPVKSGKRHYSTEASVLEKLESLHRFPSIVLQWRKMHQALESSLRPLLKRASQSGNGKLSGVYRTLTATGRMIMHEPSLQTVPKDFSFKSDSHETLVSMRSLFVAAPGCRLVSADYSQLELRIMAHFSEDKRLVEVLKKPDGDVFKAIASKLHNVTTNKVSQNQRQQAKQIVYGIMYGMGVDSLASQLNISIQNANEFMNAFRNNYPAVFSWITSTQNQCRTDQNVTTISGRRRIFKSSNKNVIELNKSLRQSVNTVIQGSAADIFKIALLNVDRRFKLKREETSSNIPRIVILLHDELIVETNENDVENVIDVIRSEMENALKLKVPLPVNVKQGGSWGLMKEL